MDTLENTATVLKKANLHPKLRLAQKLEKGGVEGLGAKTVKVVSDRIIEKVDPKDMKKKFYMRYNLEHDGEMRRYDTRLQDDNGDPTYFIQNMGEHKPGDIITMEYKKAGAKGYIDITSDAVVDEEEAPATVDNEQPPD